MSDAGDTSDRPQTPALREATEFGMPGIDTLDQLHRAETSRGKRRIATVYDAVAGRLSHHRGTLSRGDRSKPRLLAKYSLRETNYGPDEVLFRRKDAPARYAEHDMYYAHEKDLPDGGRGVLPESDLLKAVHGYSSRFYGRMMKRGGPGLQHNVDEASMDETALLAFGILLEEAGRDVLGRRGDMVFTEGAVPERTNDKETPRRNRQIVTDAVGPLDGMATRSQVRRSKRRKVGQRRTKS